MISDFLDEEDAAGPSRCCARPAHDFVILQVHSGEEQRPSAYGEFLFEEAETGELRTIECSREKSALYEERVP